MQEQRSLLVLLVIIFLSEVVATQAVEMSLWNTVMVEASLLLSFHNFSGVDVLDLLSVGPAVSGYFDIGPPGATLQTVPDQDLVVQTTEVDNDGNTIIHHSWSFRPPG